VSERGEHLQYLALRNWFACMCQRVAIVPPPGGRAPCLTSFRHTFAVTCMKRWYQQGLDVQALLPHLSIYLGHVSPQESYGYLTSVPELLRAAAQRFEPYAQVGGHAYA
jgi:integrase/recombinase XerD